MPVLHIGIEGWCNNLAEYLVGTLLVRDTADVVHRQADIAAFGPRQTSEGRHPDIVVMTRTSLGPRLAAHTVVGVNRTQKIRLVRKRSIQRLRRMSQSASSVVMVSHKMKQISKVCTRVIWLDDGVVRAEGKPRRVIQRYKRFAADLAREMDA